MSKLIAEFDTTGWPAEWIDALTLEVVVQAEASEEGGHPTTTCNARWEE